MPVDNPFLHSINKPPKFTGRPTERLPYRYIHWLDGIIELKPVKDMDLSSRDINIMTRSIFGQSDRAIGERVFLSAGFIKSEAARISDAMGIERPADKRKGQLRPLWVSAAFRSGIMSFPNIKEGDNERPAYGDRNLCPYSETELKIISRIGRAMTAEEISQDSDVGLALSTIKNQIGAMNERLFVGNILHLAAAVMTHQIEPVSLVPVKAADIAA